MPANFAELPVDRLTSSWPDTWHPDGLSVFAWRAVTFPIYTLPFWWFAGFGIDTLFKRRHPRWPSLLVGTTIFAIFAFLAIGLSFAHGTDDDRAVTIPILIGGILWILLFAAFPAAWIRNRFSRAPSQEPSLSAQDNHPQTPTL